MRGEPGTRKQTMATKRSGKRLGMASSLGAQLRKTFEVNAGTIYDPTVNERRTAVPIKVLTECQDSKTSHFNFQQDSFKWLENFELNINALMQQITTVMPEVNMRNGAIEVVLAKIHVADQISFPGKSFSCQMIISMSLLRLRDGKVLARAESESLSITKADKTILAGYDKVLIRFIRQRQGYMAGIFLFLQKNKICLLLL
jgi:hypothetical protein